MIILLVKLAIITLAVKLVAPLFIYDLSWVDAIGPAFGIILIATFAGGKD